MELFMDARSNVVVIGTGIVGMCCTLFLRSEGHSITVIDYASRYRSRYLRLWAWPLRGYRCSYDMQIDRGSCGR